MRVIVISDTHMYRSARSLPKRLIKELKHAEFIIHAGDWCDPNVVDLLTAYAPVEGVAGNNDGGEIIRRFGKMKIITIFGKKIGLVHGHGGRGSAEQQALETFRGEDLDCLIYGHSHIPVLKEINGTMVLNPGSPTDKRRQREYSFAIMDINGNGISIEHVKYSDKN